MKAEVSVRVMDTEAFRKFVERVGDFINEYARHARECAAYDIDGEWLRVPCTCGYDEEKAALSQLVTPETDF